MLIDVPICFAVDESAVALSPFNAELVEFVNLSVSNFDIALFAYPPLVVHISVYELLDRAFLAATHFAVKAILLFVKHREFVKAKLTVFGLLFFRVEFNVWLLLLP